MNRKISDQAVSEAKEKPVNHAETLNWNFKVISLVSRVSLVSRKYNFGKRMFKFQFFRLSLSRMIIGNHVFMYSVKVGGSEIKLRYSERSR